MAELKREHVKYVRDFIKKDYKLRDCCYICGSTDKLELHHLYSVSELFNKWCTTNNIKSITTEEQILELRVQFAKECADHLANINLYTLCSDHHKRLHNIYGQTYPNSMSTKIKTWLEIQKNKYNTTPAEQ
jgi:5-methylcytosine-specific restriction endonuclease McrA